MTINFEAIMADFGWILADGAVILLFLFFALLGAKKGLYETFRPIIVIVLAITCAIFLANLVTPMAAEIVWPRVEASVSDEIADAIENMDGTGVIFSDNVNRILSVLGLDDKIDEIIKDKAANAAMSVQDGLMTTIRAALEKLIHGVAFVVILLAGLLVFTLISHAIKIAKDAPVIKQIDWLGGFAIGLLEAFVILYIAIKICDWKELSFFEDYSQGTYILSRIMEL